MHQPIAFADEFGNTSFDFEKQGTHFIVASIIANKHDLPLLEIQVEEIRKNFFQTGEIKSKKVAGNHKRRLLILDKITKLNIQIFAVVVDKRKLYSEGFRHKQSFHKFINGLVYKELYKTFPNLTLIVDEHGSNDYMRGFKKYVQANHIRDLFHGSNFELEDSSKNILIQIADFIAGTLGHYFDESKKNENSQEYLKILDQKISSINYFPPEYSNLKFEPIEGEDNEFDENISNISLRSALDFIDTKKIKSAGDIEQVAFIKLLLFYQRTYQKHGFVSTKELMNHLNSGRETELTEQFFRTKIIGKLRDSGVIIASNSASGKKGYKLPTSVSDLYKFINHSNSVVIPMIKRIKKCRDIVMLSTNNQLDILSKEEYKSMNIIINSI